ncbi:MAG: Flp family type IVb pilin [Formivibrio sp.]|nr:Flp family type IVb pilin [Formivibrio sp.]
MQRILLIGRTFWQDTEGVTAIEYALLASLIAVAILGAVLALSTAVQDIWIRVSDCVANPASCA